MSLRPCSIISLAPLMPFVLLSSSSSLTRVRRSRRCGLSGKNKPALLGRANRVRRVKLLAITTSDVSIAANNGAFTVWSLIAPSSWSPTERWWKQLVETEPLRDRSSASPRYCCSWTPKVARSPQNVTKCYEMIRYEYDTICLFPLKTRSISNNPRVAKTSEPMA